MSYVSAADMALPLCLAYRPPASDAGGVSPRS
jgi:hypothetical protein